MGFKKPSGAEFFKEGDTILYSDDIRLYDAAYTTSPRFITGVKVQKGGTYRIKFTLKRGGTTNVMYGQLYVNGLPKGILRETYDANDNVFTEDIRLNQNDVVDLYAYVKQTGYNNTAGVLKLCTANIFERRTTP